jgi:uncharacterized protein YyaL (SSP411 family)
MVTSSDLLCGFEELSVKLRRSVKLDHLLALTDHNGLRALSQTLLAAYLSLGEQTYLAVAETTLRFLKETETINETHVPIGNRGWYVRRETRALYDQQPIEPGAMIEAATIAYKLNRSKLYEEILRQALGWFFGLNTKSVELYDDSTGACYDGLTPKGLNENQGAESTLAFLLAAEAFVNGFAQD